MELNELRRLTLPKLRDLARAETDLTGVVGMEKEALIEAIAKAKGISYEEASKDVSTIRAIKHDIQALLKQKAELRSSSAGGLKLRQVQRKVRKLKRLTRKLAREAKTLTTAQASAPAEAPKPAAAAKPEEAPQAKKAAPSQEAAQRAEATPPKETAQPTEAPSPAEAPAAAPAEEK